MELSAFNILSDLGVAVFYVMAIIVMGYSMYKTSYVRKEKPNQQKRVFFLFISAASLIYLFQTVYQAIFGTTSTVWLWDIYNLVQALANLMIVRMLAALYGHDIKKEHPKAPVL